MTVSNAARRPHRITISDATAAIFLGLAGGGIGMILVAISFFVR